MSLFSNLFQGANTTSSTLFSEANQYRADASARPKPASPAAPLKKRKKKKDNSDIGQVRRVGAAPASPEQHSKASPCHTKGTGTTAAQPTVPDGAKMGTCRNHRTDLSVEEAALDAHASSDHEDSSMPKNSQPRTTDTKTLDDEEATKRTVFVGNIPADTKKSSLKATFSRYGSIEAIRLRSLPIDNESRMPRNLQIKAGKVNSGGGSANAYIRFKVRDEAIAACAENMSIFSDQHIRVDMAGCRNAKSAVAHYPPARSIFIGNLALDIQEEELISVFNKGDQAMQLQDSVEAVRVVRDSKTRIGKGIAYVLFKSRVAALAALQLNGSECKGRQMRVGRVDNSHAKVSAKGGPQGSRKARGMPRQHQEKRTDEYLGQKHSKSGVKKKVKDMATAQTSGVGTAKKAQKGGSRIVKRPAVAARKAKALLAAGKVPPASALAALKKKQKQKPQGRSSKPNE